MNSAHRPLNSIVFPTASYKLNHFADNLFEIETKGKPKKRNEIFLKRWCGVSKYSLH